MSIIQTTYILTNSSLQALAGTIEKEELADLRDQFDAIDVDKSGAISLEEMRQVISLGLTMSNFHCAFLCRISKRDTFYMQSQSSGLGEGSSVEVERITCS